MYNEKRVYLSLAQFVKIQKCRYNDDENVFYFLFYIKI